MLVKDSGITDEVVRDHWINCFPVSSVPMPGANELLSYLADQGYHLGIISNGADESRISTATRLESFSCIQQLVSSDSAGVSKPNVDIFVGTALDAGYMPDQCWFIGDHPVNDIHGARKAGMKTIWLKGFHDWPEGLAMPSHTIESLVEEKQILMPTS